MSAKILRVFTPDAVDVEDVFEYSYSIVSDGEEISWVWKDGKERENVNKDYVIDSAERLGIDLDTPEAWLEAATARLMYNTMFDVEEDYESLEEAIEVEKEFAAEAKALQEDEEANEAIEEEPEED